VRSNFALVCGIARLGVRMVGGWRLPGRRVPVPPVAPAMPKTWPTGDLTVALMATCLTRTFGPDAVSRDLARLCEAAGIGVTVPADIGNLCCGMPFSSKGFPEQAQAMAERTATALLATGCQAVLIDTGTCAAFLAKTALPAALQERWNAVTVHDPAGFAAKVLIPRLLARKRLRTDREDWVLHPTCSEQKAGWAPHLLEACNAVAKASIPQAWGCCGTAGDKAWNVPELTAAATAREAAEVATAKPVLGVSTSLTCGGSVSAASGVPYRHLFSALANRLH
jgi:D-lactate dehydrogenase